MNFERRVLKLLNPQEFCRLKQIGGHKEFHLEGNAYEHTVMVTLEAEKKFGEDNFMCTVALLHDIGKIYSSFKHGENDWTYPNHSTVGAQDEYLTRFIGKSDPFYRDCQWYIMNHIKPLYWREAGTKLPREMAKLIKTMPRPEEYLVYLRNLRDLAICDLKGSLSVKPQDELIKYLEDLPL